VRLYPVPVELKEANNIVASWHRHHKPFQGHRFSIGCVDDNGVIHGVAIVGRPVARLAGKPRDVLEVTRVATDGTANACSILYGSAARAAKALGYLKIQTYTLPSESGASLRAAGWICEGEAGGSPWTHKGRPDRKADMQGVKKLRWAVNFNHTPRPIIFPEQNFNLEDNDELVLL
jgi:hypothetical protein